MAVGGLVSALLTTDPRWMEWHLSRLGEGHQVSAMVFNISCALCSLLMGGFARRLAKDLQIITMPPAVLATAQRLVRIGLGIVAVCMMGVAVFPFDRYPVAHNIFGYSMTVTYLAMIVLLPRILPIITRRFMAATYGFIATMVLLFGMYFASGQTTPRLLYIEALGLLFFFLWIMVLLRGVRVHNRI